MQNLEAGGVNLVHLEALGIMVQFVDVATEAPDLVAREPNHPAVNTTRQKSLREHRRKGRFADLVCSLKDKELSVLHGASRLSFGLSIQLHINRRLIRFLIRHHSPDFQKNEWPLASLVDQDDLLPVEFKKGPLAVWAHLWSFSLVFLQRQSLALRLFGIPE